MRSIEKIKSKWLKIILLIPMGVIAMENTNMCRSGECTLVWVYFVGDWGVYNMLKYPSLLCSF